MKINIDKSNNILNHFRCEQNTGNVNGEVEALIEASRCYLEAENQIDQLKTPTFNENLINALQSYNHAIRLLQENGDFNRASGLCLELGDSLLAMKMTSEALIFYKRATELLPNCNLSYLHTLEKVAITYAKLKDYHNAVNTFTELASVTEHSCKIPSTSVFLDILSWYLQFELLGFL